MHQHNHLVPIRGICFHVLASFVRSVMMVPSRNPSLWAPWLSVRLKAVWLHSAASPPTTVAVWSHRLCGGDLKATVPPPPRSWDEAFQTLFSTCNTANPEYHSINSPDVSEELLRRRSQSHILGDKVNPPLLSVCASCREKKKASTSWWAAVVSRGSSRRLKVSEGRRHSTSSCSEGWEVVFFYAQWIILDVFLFWTFPGVLIQPGHTCRQWIKWMSHRDAPESM